MDLKLARNRLPALAMAGGLALAAAPRAEAAIILTLDNGPGTTAFQQTNNNPCVIGDPSCSNPPGFPQTTIPPGPAGADDTLDSPTYTVGQVRALVGDQFLVGIDVNTTTQPLATERLVSFTATVADATDGREEFFLVSNRTTTPVPEPASLALFGAGLLGLGLVRRARARRVA